ncbi:MAG: ABC transporter permease subunit [Mycobacteriales bacterium]
MTRFAWLQSRTQTLGSGALLAVLALIAAITGVQIAHVYSSLVPGCQALGDCQSALSRYASQGHFLDHAFTLLMNIAPALLGIFWGAPLVARELESGTFRLAWTQSVSRPRWLVTKLALVGSATAVAAGLLTLTVTWWERGFDIVGANQYANFDIRDLAPIGYALFAFAFGALAGAVIRRTVPAMAATLAVFAGVRTAVGVWVRPHLFAPLHSTSSLLSNQGAGFIASNGGPVDIVVQAQNLPNAWILSAQLVTKSGASTSFAQRAAFLQRYCPSVANPPAPGPGPNVNHPVAAPDGLFRACFAHAARQFNVLTTYQPAHRYWTFQWTETAIFFALAVLAAAGCYWWVTRRVA